MDDDWGYPSIPIYGNLHITRPPLRRGLCMGSPLCTVATDTIWSQRLSLGESRMKPWQLAGGKHVLELRSEKKKVWILRYLFGDLPQIGFLIRLIRPNELKSPTDPSCCSTSDTKRSGSADLWTHHPDTNAPEMSKRNGSFQGRHLWGHYMVGPMFQSHLGLSPHFNQDVWKCSPLLQSRKVGKPWESTEPTRFPNGSEMDPNTSQAPRPRASPRRSFRAFQ